MIEGTGERSMKIIEAEHLCKEYKRKIVKPGLAGGIQSIFNPKYNCLKAVDDVNFGIECGESVGYVGPNGSGKSTTIKMLSGVLTPTSGKVLVNGLEPIKNRIQNNRNIGVVFGNRSQLWWDVPIIESFRVLQKLYEIPQAVFDENIERFREIMGIENLLDVPERQLSLGQRMRCNITAAFLHNPKIVYLDEPTIGLDAESKQRIRKFIKQINEERKTTFIVTSHDFQDIEALCQRIILINKGKIIIDSDIESIRKDFTEIKKITVELKGGAQKVKEMLEKEGMELKASDEYHLEVQYRTAEKNPMEVINEISRYAEIEDVSVIGQDIESIIQKIVKENSGVVQTHHSPS